MNTYADYTFYVDKYKGTLSEQSFNSYITKSSKAIERNVNRKLNQDIFNSLDSETKEKISYVACELCDYYNTFGDSTSQGKPNSISIDGVSKTNSSFASTTQNIDAKLQTIYNNLPHDWICYL